MKLYKERKMYRIRSILKHVNKVYGTNKRLRKENSEIRQKNGSLVNELQRERMDKNLLYNDLHVLQTENMDHLILSRGTSTQIAAEVSQIEAFLTQSVASMIQTSNALTQLQTSFFRIKGLIKNTLPISNNEAGSPLSSRRTRAKNRKNLRQAVIIRHSEDNLEVIEEDSHESSISPLLSSMEAGARYSRKCKKGLRNLICPRASTSRKSQGKASKSTDVNQDRNPDRTSIYIEQDMSLEESTIESPENRSPSNDASQTEDDTDSSENESTPKVSSRSDKNSPAQRSQNSSSSSTLSATPRRYSDVVKSQNNSPVEPSDTSTIDSAANSPDPSEAESSKINSSANSLDLSDETPSVQLQESTLSSITFRRGGSNRRFNVTDSSVFSRAPFQFSEGFASSGTSSGITARKATPAHKTKSSFTFYAFDSEKPRKSLGSQSKSANNSTLKAMSGSSSGKEENVETSVFSSNEKKAVTELARAIKTEDEENYEMPVVKSSKKRGGHKNQTIIAEEEIETPVPKSTRKTKKEKAVCDIPNSEYEDKENNVETPIFTSKKKTKKIKCTNMKDSLECLRNQNFPPSNATPKMYNSTPNESDKSKKSAKRTPLSQYSGNIQGIASSTQISANESQLSKFNVKYNFNETESLSPITHNSTRNLTLSDHEQTSSTLENSSTNDSSGSGRPRRNAAAKAANYREPPLNKKLRR